MFGKQNENWHSGYSCWGSVALILDYLCLFTFNLRAHTTQTDKQTRKNPY